MLKSFKYRIYPGPGQRRKLEATLESCRWLYNFFLAERKYAWDGEKSSVGKFYQYKEILQLKTVKPSLTQVYAQVLQNAASRIDKAFNSFFRRIKAKETTGYPRFKKQGQYKSFTYPQMGTGQGLKFKDDKKFNLPKIGKKDL